VYEHLEEILSLIQVVIPTNSSLDKSWWKINNDVMFSMKSFTIAWRGLAPPRTELLMCFIIRGRLNTTSRLKRVKVVVNEEATALCPF